MKRANMEINARVVRRCQRVTILPGWTSSPLALAWKQGWCYSINGPGWVSQLKPILKRLVREKAK